MDRREGAIFKVAHDQRFVFGWVNHIIDKGEQLTTAMGFEGKRNRRTRGSYAVVTLKWLRTSTEPEIEDAWERKIRWFNDFGGAQQSFDHQTGSSGTDDSCRTEGRHGAVLIVSNFEDPPNVLRVRVSGGGDGWREHISEGLRNDPGPLLEPTESSGSRAAPLSIPTLG